jgi:hypothetical protein
VYVSHLLKLSSQSKALKKPGRIAIWNKNKIITGIAMAIWITDIGFQISGKYLLPIIGESLINLAISQASYG